MKNVTPTSTARTVSFSENAMTIISFFLFLMIPDTVLSILAVARNFDSSDMWKKCINFLGLNKQVLKQDEYPNPCPEENVTQKEKEPWQRSMVLATFLRSPDPQWLTILTVIQTASGFHIPLFMEHEHQRKQTYSDFLKKVLETPLLQLTRFDYQNGIAVPCNPQLGKALAFLNETYENEEQFRNPLVIYIETFVASLPTKYPNDETACARFTAHIQKHAPALASAVIKKEILK